MELVPDKVSAGEWDLDEPEKRIKTRWVRPAEDVYGPWTELAASWKASRSN